MLIKAAKKCTGNGNKNFAVINKKSFKEKCVKNRDFSPKVKVVLNVRNNFD
jgi:hypothetical protein